MEEKIRAHIGILCINTSGGHNPSLFLVLIECQGVRIEVTLDNVKSCLICDAIAVAKRGGAGVVCTGHIMEKRYGDDAG